KLLSAMTDVCRHPITRPLRSYSPLVENFRDGLSTRSSGRSLAKTKWNEVDESSRLFLQVPPVVQIDGQNGHREMDARFSSGVESAKDVRPETAVECQHLGKADASLRIVVSRIPIGDALNVERSRTGRARRVLAPSATKS